MDSLEALPSTLDVFPSVDYESLRSLPPLNEKDGVQQSLAVKADQEHIYAQVTTNGPCQDPKAISPQYKDKSTINQNLDANSNILYNTYVLKKPTFTHSSSVPDVRKPMTNGPSVRPKNSVSCNTTKVHSKSQTANTTIDSSVFSISGRRVVVSSGFKGSNVNLDPDAKEQESGLSSLKESQSSSETEVRTEIKRRKLQVCTDCFSLCLFVPGTVICILSPWLLVPVYIIPNLSEGPFQTLVWVACISSALLVFMGCMVGNVVWYKKGHVWKCILHCGRGPKNHYWGDSLTSPSQTV